MRANINYTAFSAQAAMSKDAQLDKAEGKKVTSTSAAKIEEQIEAQCEEKHKQAEEEHDAATTKSIFTIVCTAVAVIGTAAAACSVAGGMLAVGGLAAILPAIVCVAVPAAIVGAIGNLVGRGLGGLAANGSEEDATAAKKRAGEIDLDRKVEINTMHRSGADRIVRGNDNGRTAQDNITKMLDRKVDA